MEDYETGEITWISWGDEIIGPGPGGRLPVYIQSHAIVQAYKRLGIAKGVAFLHHILIRSLSKPRVIPGRDGQFLVEVRVGRERVGYLVAERIDETVLLKTFLLITMQGTPEGGKLHQRLRMSRGDLDYLGLDNLTQLATTDLLRDDEIAEIFRECGCEGLLALAHANDWGQVIEGFATEFKTYFGSSFGL